MPAIGVFREPVREGATDRGSSKSFRQSKSGRTSFGRFGEIADPAKFEGHTGAAPIRGARLQLTMICSSSFCSFSFQP
jgi:hypothetical protein